MQTYIFVTFQDWFLANNVLNVTCIGMWVLTWFASPYHAAVVSLSPASHTLTGTLLDECACQVK